MKLETTVKLLQYFGAFPVTYEKNIASENKDRNITISKKYLCCTIIQMGFIGCRINDVINVTHSYLPLLSIVIYFVENAWQTLVFVLSLKNLKVICECVQGCSFSFADKGNQERTYYSCAYINLCLQIGSAAFLVLMGLLRYYNSFKYLFSSLSVLHAITIMCLVNYFIQSILRNIRNSLTCVNQTLSSFLKGPQTREPTTELTDLIRRYWQAGGLLLLLNSAFGLHIFFLSTLTFAKLTLVAYYMSISNIFYNAGVSATEFSTLYLALYSMSAVLMDFLLVCIASQRINDERHATTVILSRILRRHSENMEKQFIIQIRVFLYQVRSSQPGLTGCDFFHVNRPLFYGMIMVVISYFILLVQFKIFQ